MIDKYQQAVVIENKIWAEDQPQQLQRYFETLKKRGFHDIQLLYLTLDGHAPSEDSVGDLDYAEIKTLNGTHGGDMMTVA